MPEHDSIFAIAQMMQDENRFHADMADACGAFANIFQDRYISRIETALNRCKQNITKNPPREIAMLQALKPFMDERVQPDIDKSIEQMIAVNTLKNIRQELALTSGQMLYKTATVDDNSVHYDGVYDVDERCANTNLYGQGGGSAESGQLPMLLMMMMLMMQER